MTRYNRIVLAGALALASSAFASDQPSACTADANARGLPERIQNITQQMDRIELTADPEDRRRLIDLHMKVMHEAIRELRVRAPGEGCRVELMHAMMEQMMRHQLAARDPD